MYPESFIKELENTVQLSDLIGRKITLKKRGRDFVACCPFHHEKTPSFSVSDIKGIYHCFGCGKSGNIFTFIMEMERLNFKEAVEYIANLYGIPLPKIEKKKIEKKEEIDEIDLIYKINEESCKFFEKNLFEFYGKPALTYAQKRGLKISNIKQFRLGYAKDDYSSLLNHLKGLGYDEKIIEKSGVIAKGDNNNYYDKFRNRLMFPVLDKKGRVIAFTGRILDDGMPKYMNSPETKIYKKGYTLFNYFFARKAIFSEDYAVLVEGNMDAISLFINGVENVVAPMGTGITENQIQELWKATSTIFVCLDGDSAGQKASIRLSRLVLPLIKIGKNIKFVFLPQNIDPDDFIKQHGKNEFDNLLKNSISLSDYLWDTELKNLKIDEEKEIIPEKKAELENNIFKLLDTVKDLKLKSHFEQFYRNKLWKLNRVSNNINNKSNIKTETLKNIKNGINIDLMEKIEKKICFLLINFPDIIKDIFEKYKIDIFSINFLNDKCNSIILLIEEYMALDDKNEFQKKLKNLLVKNDLDTYISNCDIFFNNSCIGSLTEGKGLEMINILLLEKEVMLVEFDLKEASEIGDIIKTKKLNEELLNLKDKIGRLLSNSSFV